MSSNKNDNFPAIIIKESALKALSRQHPWVFSGAIQKTNADIANGSIVAVQNSKRTTLGYAFYSKGVSIALRMISFGAEPPAPEIWTQRLTTAYSWRQHCPELRDSTGWRMVNAEADGLPGLIVDYYDGHCVIQSLCAGTDSMIPLITEKLASNSAIKSIFERSDHAGRSQEGLQEQCRQLYGTTPDSIDFIEHGLHFKADIRHGQKTGFFLDQRENRFLVRSLSSKAHVINLCAYSGGFSVAALAGGAASVTSVDISAKALAEAQHHVQLNGFNDDCHTCVEADVFEYVRQELPQHDLIVLDPPSFTKNRSDIDRATRGYKDLHLQLFRRCRPGTMLLRCSCSRHVDLDLFRKIIFGAALDAGRDVSFLGCRTQPADHPVSVYLPEQEYLKAVLLLIR